MIAKTVNKLWQGKFVSVRDYEVKKAISQGGMVLTYNGDKMTLTVDELKNLKPSPQLIKSTSEILNARISRLIETQSSKSKESAEKLQNIQDRLEKSRKSYRTLLWVGTYIHGL